MCVFFDVEDGWLEISIHNKRERTKNKNSNQTFICGGQYRIDNGLRWWEQRGAADDRQLTKTEGKHLHKYKFFPYTKQVNSTTLNA